MTSLLESPCLLIFLSHFTQVLLYSWVLIKMLISCYRKTLLLYKMAGCNLKWGSTPPPHFEMKMYPLFYVLVKIWPFSEMFETFIVKDPLIYGNAPCHFGWKSTHFPRFLDTHGSEYLNSDPTDHNLVFLSLCKPFIQVSLIFNHHWLKSFISIARS